MRCQRPAAGHQPPPQAPHPERGEPKLTQTFLTFAVFGFSVGWLTALRRSRPSRKAEEPALLGERAWFWRRFLSQFSTAVRHFCFSASQHRSCSACFAASSSRVGKRLADCWISGLDFIWSHGSAGHWVVRWSLTSRSSVRRRWWRLARGTHAMPVSCIWIG